MVAAMMAIPVTRTVVATTLETASLWRIRNALAGAPGKSSRRSLKRIQRKRSGATRANAVTTIARSSHPVRRPVGKASRR